MGSGRCTGLPRITRGIISIGTLQTGDLFLASGSEPTINVSGEAGHKIDCWLAVARQEKIINLKGLSGYNHRRITRETCILKNPAFVGDIKEKLNILVQSVV